MYDNQLIDGTLIDIGGVILMYQDPISLASARPINPQVIVQRMNNLKPHCPVMFNEIQFSCVSQYERLQYVLHNLPNHHDPNDADGSSHHHPYFPWYTSPRNLSLYPYHHMMSSHHNLSEYRQGPIHIPSNLPIPYGTVDDNHDTHNNSHVVTTQIIGYIFPSCGHVHGYHKSLEGKSCSLCRKKGPYVPLAFQFEPMLDRYNAQIDLNDGELEKQDVDQTPSIPTHVFNPCGHVASYETCVYWSNLTIFQPVYPSHPMLSGATVYPANHIQRVGKCHPDGYYAVCPFCGIALDPNQPYSRILMQSNVESPVLQSMDIESSISRLSEATNGSINEATTATFTQNTGRLSSDLVLSVNRNTLDSYWSSPDFQQLLFQAQSLLSQRESCLNANKMVSVGFFGYTSVFPTYAPQQNS